MDGHLHHLCLFHVLFLQFRDMGGSILLEQAFRTGHEGPCLMVLKETGLSIDDDTTVAVGAVTGFLGRDHVASVKLEADTIVLFDELYLLALEGTMKVDLIVHEGEVHRDDVGIVLGKKPQPSDLGALEKFVDLFLRHALILI